MAIVYISRGRLYNVVQMNPGLSQNHKVIGTYDDLKDALKRVDQYPKAEFLIQAENKLFFDVRI